MNQPGGTRLRRMGVLEIVDETFRLYRAHFLSLVLASALVQAPLGVLSALLQLSAGLADGSGDASAEALLADGALMVLFGLLVVLLALLGYLVQSVAMYRLASGAMLGQPLTVREAYRGLTGLWPLCWTGLLSGLVLTLLVVTVLGIPVAMYLGLGWSLAGAIVVLERRSGWGALRRSAALVKGNRWRTLGVLLISGLLIWILTLIPSALLGAATAVAQAVLDLGRWVQTASDTLQALLGAVTGSLFGPLYFLTTTLLYYELRVRKEAFDLEQQLAQLGAPALDPNAPGS